MGDKSDVLALSKGRICINHDFIKQEVSREAYFIYLQGTNPGDPATDWTDAEKIVKNHFRYLVQAEYGHE